MNVDVPDFHADFGTFKGIITELEHRLGALIVLVCALLLATENCLLRFSMPPAWPAQC
jgi:hypothetical protein